MKRFKLPLLLAISCAIAVGLFIRADHTDAPAVSGSIDITDFYAFESPENSSNMVLVANVSALLAPSATGAAVFDPNSMIEFNIDNNGDNIEDLVIQCVFDGNNMHVYGPYAPASTGINSSIDLSANMVRTKITAYGGDLQMAEKNGVKVFAGPRDDPFFFDFAQFGAILGGTAGSFNDPGNDTFAGTNVLSAVVEVAKSQLGSGTLNIWVETKRKS